MQGYQNHPYYQQQQPYYAHNGYPSMPGYQNYPAYGQPNPNPPFIPTQNAPSNPYEGMAAQSNPYRSSKHQHVRPVANPTDNVPLKSALKRPTNGNPTSGTSKKKRKEKTEASADQSTDGAPLDRARTVSNSKAPEWDHMFLSFIGTSELKLEHFTPKALAEIKDMIQKSWPPGLDFEEKRSYAWRIRLGNSPWDLNGPSAAHAMQLIVSIFSLFATRGFSVQTTVNVGGSIPRIIFVSTPMEQAIFFIAHFTKKGRRLTLVRPPLRVAGALAPELEMYIPGQIAIDEAGPDETRIVELKPATGLSGDVDAAFFLLLVLRVFNDLGFILETTVAMAPKLTIGPLSLGPRRELYIFKSGPPAVKH